MDRDSNQEEIDRIKSDLEKYYVLGHAEYDPGLYKEILHPEWKMYHLENGNLAVVDRDEFCSWYEPHNQDPDLVWSFEIFTVDVTGDQALVKMSLENQQVMYIDYLSLLKVAGKWWIVHKIYHQVDKI